MMGSVDGFGLGLRLSIGFQSGALVSETRDKYPTHFAINCKQRPASGPMLAIHGVRVPEPRTATGSAPDAVGAVQLIAN